MAGQHHVTPLKTFLKVYGSLIALTILTVATAQIDLGVLNTPLAMLIATTKVLIVMLWFMHLKYDTKLNKITIASAFFFLLVFFSLTAMDVFTRFNMEQVPLTKVEKEFDPGAKTEGIPPAKLPEVGAPPPSNGK